MTLYPVRDWRIRCVADISLIGEEELAAVCFAVIGLVAGLVGGVGGSFLSSLL